MVMVMVMVTGIGTRRVVMGMRTGMGINAVKLC